MPDRQLWAIAYAVDLKASWLCSAAGVPNVHDSKGIWIIVLRKAYLLKLVLCSVGDRPRTATRFSNVGRSRKKS